jgi:hypothetical protein
VPPRTPIGELASDQGQHREQHRRGEGEADQFTAPYSRYDDRADHVAGEQHGDRPRGETHRE